MFAKWKISIFLAAASGTLTFAHGVVKELLIDGQRYEGFNPDTDPYQNPPPQRVTWSVPNDGPVQDVSSAAIVCDRDSKPGALVAPASAGSKITFFWNKWPESHKGPTMTYLAACPSGDCRKEDPTSLNWFKIDHAGFLGDGKWASDTFMKQNNTWTVTIPQKLKAGAYLLRHELVALHASDAANGAQFYPMCVNLKVSGSGNGVPDKTVKFPGAYKADDKGILLNIWWPPVQTYDIPGPPIASLVSSGSEEQTPAPEEPTTTPTEATKEPTPAPEEPTPTSTEVTKEPTPAPEEPTPTPTEVTKEPTPEEPTPAPTKVTSTAPTTTPTATTTTTKATKTKTTKPTKTPSSRCPRPYRRRRDNKGSVRPAQRKKRSGAWNA